MNHLEELINGKGELFGGRKPAEPYVLSSRIRFARNLDNYSFPGWAKEDKRKEVLEKCIEAVMNTPEMKEAYVFRCDELTDLEIKILIERHLISSEFLKERKGRGVIVSKDQTLSVMINEEDHLRMQGIRTGYKFNPIFKTLDTLDSELESELDFAFSNELGYLTACPTNIGTGMRASVMLHLPGLVIIDQMEKVVRAVNQLGLAVRGQFGEGSDANGSIFQISNQQTLGSSEQEIIKRLSGVLDTIIEQEKNTRQRLLEDDDEGAFNIIDKVSRAYGILKYSRSLHSGEAMNLLSLILLGIDYKFFPEKHRKTIYRLFIESQPGHIQMVTKQDISPKDRDRFRASMLRDKMEKISEPNFKLG